METTAGDARSAAATSAVRREVLTAFCATATPAALCAPAEDTESLGGESRQPSRATPSARRARLTRVRRRMRLPDRLEKKFRRVRGRDEIESLRWCRRAGVLIVSSSQQSSDVAERTAPQSDIDHGPYQHTHHVVQESVGLDMKAHPPAVDPRPPFSQGETAAVMRLVAFRGEGKEVVLALDQVSRFAEQPHVERTGECPPERPAERGGSTGIQANVVTVPAGDRRFPGMKANLHRLHGLDPAILRKQRIDCAMHVGSGPTERCAEADALTQRMDPGIGSARRVRHGSTAEEALQNPLELGLNGATGGLTLPADKAGAYAIQGKAAAFITRIDGSFSGVVGLPLAETAQILARLGMPVL